MPVIRIDDFSRGLHLADTPLNTPDGGCRIFRNVDRTSIKGVKSRRGSSTIRAGHNAHTMFYHAPYNQWYTGVGYNLYRNFSNIHTSSSSSRWSFASMQSAPGFPTQLYACNGGSVRALTFASQRRWGFPRPANPPSASPTFGGGMSSSSRYYYVYTYYNASTGVESNPSDSDNVWLGTHNAVTLTGLTPSTWGQVTHKHIYRSGADGGVLYYLTEISNSQTTFTDTFPDGNLNPESVLYSNGAVRDTFHLCAGPYNNSMFWTEWQSSSVYYSRIGYGESVENHFVIGGAQIVKLVIFGGDLYAITPSTVYQIYGDNPYYARHLSGIVGTTNAESIAVTSKGIIWQAHDGIRIFTGGSQSTIVGHRALRPIFNGDISEIYGPINAYHNYATFARGEYLFGNANYTLAIDMESGRIRELNLPISAAHYATEIDAVAVVSSNNILALEEDPGRYTGSWNYDYTTYTALHLKTKAYDLPNASRISTISVYGRTDGVYVTVTAYIDGSQIYLGTMSSAVSWRTTTFDVNVVGQAVSVEIRAYNYNVTNYDVEIEAVEIEHHPVELLLIGTDPAAVPGKITSGHTRVEFKFSDPKAEGKGKVYKYERISWDVAVFYPHTLYYRRAGGLNRVITNLSNTSRGGGSVSLDHNGLIDNIYVSGTLTNADLELYGLTLQRSAVLLKCDFGNYKSEYEGYFESYETSMRWLVPEAEAPNKSQVYVFHRLVIFGNPNNYTWTVSAVFSNTTVTLGSSNYSNRSNFAYEIDRCGVLDSVGLSGSFDDVGSRIDSLELKASPVYLNVKLGEQAFQVPAYWQTNYEGFYFDFQEVTQSIEGIYTVERISLDIYTRNQSVDLSISFTGSGISFAENSIQTSEREIQTFDVHRMGPIDRVELDGNSLSALTVYGIELNLAPLTLDVYLDDKIHKIPGVIHNTTNVRYDLTPLNEAAQQTVYLFERFFIDGDTDSYTVTNYLRLISSNADSVIGSFYAANREQTDFPIDKMGRLDEFYMTGSFHLGIHLSRLELVAHTVTLRVHVNNEIIEIPGRLRSANQEMYFEIYSHMVPSMQHVYRVGQFFYDVDPNSQSMAFELKFFNQTAIALMTRNESSRVSGEIPLTKQGRLQYLKITSDFSQMFQAIYRMELTLDPVNPRGTGR